MTIRSQLPYAHLFDPKNSSPAMRKVQALVSADDKRTVLSALGGDDGILTFLIQHSFLRTAEFIRKNKLNVYDSSNYSRIVNFIRNGTDTCPSGDAPVSNDTGAASHNQHPTTSARSVGSTPRKTSSRRSKAESKTSEG